MPLPILLAAAAISVVTLISAEEVSAKEEEKIDTGVKELEARLKIIKNHIDMTTRGIVVFGILLFLIFLSSTWLALVFFVFIAIFISIYILMFMKNLRLFMKCLLSHKFNLHSAVDVFIDCLAKYKVRIRVNKELDDLVFFKSFLHDVFGSSSYSIESEIFRRSKNYSPLKHALRNSILLFIYCLMFLCLMFLIPLVL